MGSKVLLYLLTVTTNEDALLEIPVLMMILWIDASFQQGMIMAQVSGIPLLEMLAVEAHSLWLGAML